MVKSELKRAFKSKGFYLSLIIGIVICILALKENGCLYPYEETYWGLNISYDWWIMFYGQKYKNLMLTLMPLLTVICYGSSFLEDKKSGFSKVIYTRINRKKYIRAKYIANFVVSFVVIFVPLIISLLVLLMKMPNIKPNIAINNQVIQQYAIFPNLYYSHPIVYIIMTSFIYGIIGGIYSSVALVASLKIKNAFVVLTTPFLFVFFIDMIFHFVKNRTMSPNYYLSMFGYAKLSTVGVEIIVGLLLTFIMFYIGGKNEEVL